MGPKQLKKLHKKQSRKSKILSMVTGGKKSASGIFSNGGTRRNNEYEISKGTFSLSLYIKTIYRENAVFI